MANDYSWSLWDGHWDDGSMTLILSIDQATAIRMLNFSPSYQLHQPRSSMKPLGWFRVWWASDLRRWPVHMYVHVTWLEMLKTHIPHRRIAPRVAHPRSVVRWEMRLSYTALPTCIAHASDIVHDCQVLVCMVACASHIGYTQYWPKNKHNWFSIID